MNRLIGSVAIVSLVATSALSSTAVTTSNVNFRSGPTISSEKFGVLSEGTEVELLDCNDSGSWCAVALGNQNGFVSGKYLSLIEADQESADAWPRSYDVGDGATLVLYEPQFSEWQDFETLQALIAAEFLETAESSPVFGVIGLSGLTTRDIEKREIVVSDVSVTQVDFGAFGRDEISRISLAVGKLLPTGPIEIPEERVLVSLAAQEHLVDTKGLKAEPPIVFVSEDPARLLITDGPAIYAPVRGGDALEFVVNTNWDLFRLENVHWLRDGEAWQTAEALTGPWKAVTALPSALQSLPEDGNWTDARAALPPLAYDEGAPRLIYSDDPAELLLFEGEPRLVHVEGGDLEWAENTEADLFRLKTTGTWYFLASGRWFSAPSLDGPWTFATPDLPGDFQNIPVNAPYYSVRASVPGTSEASEARLRASIPELARLEISAIEAPEVAYDGDPKFEPIEGTALQYAVNTAWQVIQVADQYFLVADGIWFVSDSPEGPWEVAREVPEQIYDIPASSPAHNVTYVYVKEDGPDYVWTGYTPGYVWTFLAWGAIVYGSGWYYPPYWGTTPGGPVYWPRPVTYGAGAYYNPARGTFGRYGYAYGPYRGIEARSAYNPRTGTYVRGAQVHGPGGSRGFVAASNPRLGARGVARGGSSVYGSWGSAAVQRGSEYARIKGGQTAAGGKGVKWDSSQGSGFVVDGRRGNVVAGRDGNVYRKVGNDWQRFDGSWKSASAPRREDLQRAGGTTPRAQPGAGRLPVRDRTSTGRLPQAGTLPSLGSRTPTGTQPKATTPARTPSGSWTPPQVETDYRSRERANQRSIERSRAATPSYQSRPSTTRSRPSAQPSHARPSSRSYSGARAGGRSGGGGRGGGGRGGGGRGGGGRR